MEYFIICFRYKELIYEFLYSMIFSIYIENTKQPSKPEKKLNLPACKLDFSNTQTVSGCWPSRSYLRTPYILLDKHALHPTDLWTHLRWWPADLLFTVWLYRLHNLKMHSLIPSVGTMSMTICMISFTSPP